MGSESLGNVRRRSSQVSRSPVTNCTHTHTHTHTNSLTHSREKRISGSRGRSRRSGSMLPRSSVPPGPHRSCSAQRRHTAAHGGRAPVPTGGALCARTRTVPEQLGQYDGGDVRTSAAEARPHTLTHSHTPQSLILKRVATGRNSLSVSLSLSLSVSLSLCLSLFPLAPSLSLSFLDNVKSFYFIFIISG